jgi:hypothetical protein
MIRLISFCVGVALAGSAAAAPVEWDLVATDSQITVASLTLAGPDSTGSASWPLLSPTATYTGDSFSFNFDFPHHQPLTPAFAPDAFGCGARYQLCDFNISWSEIGDQLTAVNIRVDAFDDSIFASLSAAVIGSMGLPYDPCAADESCRLSGAWVDAPGAVPEPSNLALLAVAFGFLGLVKLYGRSLL